MADGPSVYEAQDGTVIYRASALGHCSKALIASGLEYEPLPPPPEVAARFRRGHEAENKIRALMRDEGWWLWNEEAEVNLHLTKKIIVRGHIDNMSGRKDRALVDAAVTDYKSQTQSAWNSFERNGWDSGFFPNYRWQFSAYMHAAQRPGRLVRALVDEAGRVVKIAVEEVDRPFYTRDELRMRVLLLESQRLTGDLPRDCDQRDYPCPYFWLPGHSRKPDDGEEGREKIEDPQLDALAREYEEARRDEKVAKSRRESVRSALRTAVGDKLKVRTGSGVRITFSEQDGRDTFDVGRMREDGVYEKYRRPGGPYETIRVTLPKKKDDEDEEEEGEG